MYKSLHFQTAAAPGHNSRSWEYKAVTSTKVVWNRPSCWGRSHHSLLATGLDLVCIQVTLCYIYINETVFKKQLFSFLSLFIKTFRTLTIKQLLVVQRWTRPLRYCSTFFCSWGQPHWSLFDFIIHHNFYIILFNIYCIMVTVANCLTFQLKCIFFPFHVSHIVNFSFSIKLCWH